MKKVIFFILFFFSTIFAPSIYAQNNSFVSIVNPIRGNDFWDIKDQKTEIAVLGQVAILDKLNLSATWLLRFDALDNKNIINVFKNRPLDEQGLFLEVTPTLTTQAKVEYHKSNTWHSAGSAFLTGYERDEREKLIDTSFEKFKSIFGYYPVSVGAWWIDSYSLGYMQKKYGITAALIVADQYSTDNYQIWGQYFGTPYYPVKNNALHPAQSLENKLDVVMMQWAARDPVNSYGNGVTESTFSVQANDYMDYHNLDTKYFSSLIDVYTKQSFNQFAHLVVGLENSYSWDKYSDEYQKQIRVLKEKKDSSQLSVVTMKDFSNWYRKNFPKLSPAQIIIASDPLGSFKKVVWFMDPYYRAGWFINSDGSVLRDIRQYIDGEEELCLKKRCDSVNFATSATRVLDDVSFGNRWVLDQGKISDLKVEKRDENYSISYKNEAGNLRQLEFLPRDIGVDGEIFSIDVAILNAIKKENITPKNSLITDFSLKWSFGSIVLELIKFLLFLILAIIFPGIILTDKYFSKGSPFLLRLFISLAVGLVMLTLLFYITSLLKIRPLIFVYTFSSLVIFIRFKFFNLISVLPKFNRLNDLFLIAIILAGTIFQAIPVFKNGLNFAYGIGFWGPNTHDGVWHMALINQLIKSVPPENPIYSSVILKHYHFFYDLLIAATFYLINLPVADLVFRFYPVVFSLMLGVGSYYLFLRLFENKLGIIKTRVAVIFSLYLIYFAGSFGWIVEFLRERHFGGESAFWANQAISFNLNPPFAISLVIIIALLLILFNSLKSKNNYFLTILLAGTLIGFKSYGAILILVTILLVGLIKRQIGYLIIFTGALLMSIWIFLSNFNVSSQLLAFAPFWFIHSMIDSPDRVGWTRLSLAREAGLEKNNWFKFISVEIFSLFIFIFGNLGIRFFGLFPLYKVKTIFEDNSFLFIFIFSLLSLTIPVLFVQSGNPWNTIQFSYYGLYIAAVVAGVLLSSLVWKLPKYISVMIIFIIIVLAPINSIVTANGYLTDRPHAFIPSREQEALQFLSNQPDGRVLTYPYDKNLKQKMPEPWPILVYDSTAYVSAFSKKAVYLEDESQNQILLTDSKKRLIASQDFFLKPTLEGIKFLQDNHIKYIYLQKIYNTRLDEDKKFIENIFENDDEVIYKLNLD